MGVVAWFVAKPTVLKLFWFVVKAVCSKLCCCCCCCCSSKKEEEGDSIVKREEAHSDDFYKEININSLKSLLDTANDELEGLVNEDKKEGEVKKEKFDPSKGEKHRFDEEAEVTVAKFKEQLEFRVN
jgi:hypothetical protein